MKFPMIVTHRPIKMKITPIGNTKESSMIKKVLLVILSIAALNLISCDNKDEYQALVKQCGYIMNAAQEMGIRIERERVNIIIKEHLERLPSAAAKQLLKDLVANDFDVESLIKKE